MKKVTKVLICGGGLMGCGIGHMLSGNPDLEILVYDMVENSFYTRLRKTFSQLLARGCITETEVENRVSRVAFTTDFCHEFIGEADLVIECVFESLSVKQDMFEKLEAVCNTDTIFCTNTSVMSPTLIAEKLSHKSRLVGTHFWNPAYLIPLVEVIKSDYTDHNVAQTVFDFLIQCGKCAVMCNRDVPGFIANRMQHALWREAIYIVEQGIADAAAVDEAVRYSFGLRLPQLGPMENADMVGLDLTYNIHSYILGDLCDSHEPSPMLTKLKEDGKLGFKTHEGFQQWNEEKTADSFEGLNNYLIKMLYEK